VRTRKANCRSATGLKNMSVELHSCSGGAYLPRLLTCSLHARVTFEHLSRFHSLWQPTPDQSKPGYGLDQASVPSKMLGLPTPCRYDTSIGDRSLSTPPHPRET
jgi:hypothetical protein